MKVKIGPYKTRGERKIKIKIDKYDTWGIDHTLAMIIVPMLEQYRDTSVSYFYVDDEDVPEELRTGFADQEYDEVQDDAEIAKHKWFINELIWAFTETRDGWEEKFYSGEPDIRFREADGEGLSEMYRGPNDTFQVDREGMEKHYDRMKNATQLFGKYYFHLWD